MGRPFAERRARARRGAGRRPRPVHGSRPPPATTTSPPRWFELFEGAGLDGLVVKPNGCPTRPTGA